LADIDYEVPTWSQIYDMLLCQAQKILVQDYKADIVIGVSRGGLVPARILTDLLETPELATIQISFYQNIAQPTLEPTLKQTLSVPIEGEKVLLVDDIADTGGSLKLAQAHLHQQGALETKTATLYLKPQSIWIPDFFEKQTSAWVVFPWDTKETLRKINQHQLGKRTLNKEVAKLVKAGLPKLLAEKLLKDILKEA
jgi:hypoxanthine phosphoribosyltransferase